MYGLFKAPLSKQIPTSSFDNSGLGLSQDVGRHIVDTCPGISEYRYINKTDKQYRLFGNKKLFLSILDIQEHSNKTKRKKLLRGCRFASRHVAGFEDLNLTITKSPIDLIMVNLWAQC